MNKLSCAPYFYMEWVTFVKTSLLPLEIRWISWKCALFIKKTISFYKKNSILHIYKKLKPLIWAFIKNSIFGNNKRPLVCPLPGFIWITCPQCREWSIINHPKVIREDAQKKYSLLVVIYYWGTLPEKKGKMWEFSQVGDPPLPLFGNDMFFFFFFKNYAFFCILGPFLGGFPC